MRLLGLPHLVVAFDSSTMEACRANGIPVFGDEDATFGQCASRSLWTFYFALEPAQTSLLLCVRACSDLTATVSVDLTAQVNAYNNVAGRHADLSFTAAAIVHRSELCLVHRG